MRGGPAHKVAALVPPSARAGWPPRREHRLNLGGLGAAQGDHRRGEVARAVEPGARPRRGRGHGSRGVVPRVQSRAQRASFPQLQHAKQLIERGAAAQDGGGREGLSEERLALLLEKVGLLLEPVLSP